MWGNLLGWCISAGMVVATAIGLFALSRSLNQISPPTAFSNSSGAGNAIELPDGIDDLITKDSGPADPLSLYLKAISQYNDSPAVFDDFAQSGRRDELLMTQSTLDLLVQASGNLPAAIFIDTPQAIVKYGSNTPLDGLRVLGECLNRSALFAKLSDKNKSRAEFDASFSLGARLARERITYAELTDGLGLMSGASIELADLEKTAHHDDRAEAYNNFAKSLTDFTTQKLTPIETVLSSVDPNIIEQNAGDIFWIAMNSKSKMWKTEAILSMGRLKWHAPTVGDNRGATRLLNEWSQSESDPILKCAATTALDLTQEDYDKLH
jgi:hypothetical protein